MNISQIVAIKNEQDFQHKALSLFRQHYNNNKVYSTFCKHLNITERQVKKITDIPFLPISFFKSHTVELHTNQPQVVFSSSGTTGTITSKHFVKDLKTYETSYINGFQHFYGPISNFCVLALLPSYLEREGSSLIYMAQDFIKRSRYDASGFYLNNISELKETLLKLNKEGTKTLLIGVSFALLDMIESTKLELSNTIIMETGGMKGRRKELIREELHNVLSHGFGVAKIHSEYGMTELLSQGYSKGDGLFKTPPWMRILTRATDDPLQIQTYGKSGGINVIDLANIDSCPFIATQDLGKVYKDGSFEILGRFDHSDVRGCNLMAL